MLARTSEGMGAFSNLREARLAVLATEHCNGDVIVIHCIIFRNFRFGDYTVIHVFRIPLFHLVITSSSM